MLRDRWVFEYTANKLAEAATRKREWHKGRTEFWKAAKDKVMGEVKESGIEVSESAGGGNYTSNSLRNAPQVMVRNDLQQKLTECHQKIQEHLAKTQEYDGWVQVLNGNPEARFQLNSDDYLFFFGK